MNNLAKRIKNVGPGALVAAAFIGPGTVTSCSISGATAGYTLLWAMLLSVISMTRKFVPHFLIRKKHFPLLLNYVQINHDLFCVLPNFY